MVTSSDNLQLQQYSTERCESQQHPSVEITTELLGKIVVRFLDEQVRNKFRWFLSVLFCLFFLNAVFYTEWSWFAECELARRILTSLMALSDLSPSVYRTLAEGRATVHKIRKCLWVPRCVVDVCYRMLLSVLISRLLRHIRFAHNLPPLGGPACKSRQSQKGNWNLKPLIVKANIIETKKFRNAGVSFALIWLEEGFSRIGQWNLKGRGHAQHCQPNGCFRSALPTF